MDSGDLTFHLHDSVHWVNAKAGKTLAGHIKSGMFKVDDIVEIVSTTGSPLNLLVVCIFIISLHICSKTYPMVLLKPKFNICA